MPSITSILIDDLIVDSRKAKALHFKSFCSKWGNQYSNQVNQHTPQPMRTHNSLVLVRLAYHYYSIHQFIELLNKNIFDTYLQQSLQIHDFHGLTYYIA